MFFHHKNEQRYRYLAAERAIVEAQPLPERELRRQAMNQDLVASYRGPGGWRCWGDGSRFGGFDRHTSGVRPSPSEMLAQPLDQQVAWGEKHSPAAAAVSTPKETKEHSTRPLLTIDPKLEPLLSKFEKHLINKLRDKEQALLEQEKREASISNEFETRL